MGKRQAATKIHTTDNDITDDDETIDPVPSNPDEFRRELTRRIYSFLAMWRGCREPLCRRARACRGRTFACAPTLPDSPKQTARVMARMRRVLERRLAERDAQRPRVTR
jgi:hypothetical protein